MLRVSPEKRLLDENDAITDVPLNNHDNKKRDRPQPWNNRQYILFTLCLATIAGFCLLNSESSSLRGNESFVISQRSVDAHSLSSSSSSSDDMASSDEVAQVRVREEEEISTEEDEEVEVVEYKHPIKQISLIGERNSGTKWTWAHLHECFNHSIPVSKYFTRYKHWFQDESYERYANDTLVISQFRNPYDWLRAMQKIPHHSPEHLFLDWKPFLEKPWTMKRIGKDLKMKGDEMCQQHFRYKDLVSCSPQPIPKEEYKHKLHYSEDKPFYEMRNDGSGLPYNNIMEMRTDKIRNFMTVKDFPNVRDLWVVQYEYLLAKGTKSLIDRVSEWTGIEPKCTPYGPQFRRSRNVSDAFIDYVTEHIDWSAEELIGYEPRKSGNNADSPSDNLNTDEKKRFML